MTGFTATHDRICCRCFLPDLTGFTSLRCTGPGHIPIMTVTQKLLMDKSTGIAQIFAGSWNPAMALPALGPAVIILKSGGERGIRTPVGACGPQIDFESIPLRPLRYLSGFFCYYTAETLHAASLHYILAERAGFEPAVHLCGRTHDFQSCSFGHSDISPRFI